MKLRTFRAERKLDDYLVQPFHVTDEKTKAQRGYVTHQGHVAQWS